MEKYLTEPSSDVFFTEKMDYLTVGRISGVPANDTYDLENFFSTKILRKISKKMAQVIPKLETIQLRPPTISSRPDKTKSMSKSGQQSKDQDDIFNNSLGLEKHSEFSIGKKSLATELSYLRKGIKKEQPSLNLSKAKDPAEIKEMLSEHKRIGYDKPALPKNYFKIQRNIMPMSQKTEMSEILEEPSEERRTLRGINKGYVDYQKQK
jgi:hypothetical protein